MQPIFGLFFGPDKRKTYWHKQWNTMLNAFRLFCCTKYLDAVKRCGHVAFVCDWQETVEGWEAQTFIFCFFVLVSGVIWCIFLNLMLCFVDIFDMIKLHHYLYYSVYWLYVHKCFGGPISVSWDSTTRYPFNLTLYEAYIDLILHHMDALFSVPAILDIHCIITTYYATKTNGYYPQPNTHARRPTQTYAGHDAFLHTSAYGWLSYHRGFRPPTLLCSLALHRNTPCLCSNTVA